jgi:hypothetical protein
MPSSRLSQFKTQAKLLMRSSEWLCVEMDRLIEEDEFYQVNPDLDSPGMMADRLFRIDEMTKRARWEDNNQKQLLEKYKDLL